MATDASQVYDVMLSYSWAQKPLVHSIYDRLKEKNIKVWIDKEQITSGDIFQKMAEGVNNSKIIIPFISNEYKSSISAQRELKAAAIQNKIIIPVRTEEPVPGENDSTELLIAGKLYFTFYNDEMVNENFDAFHKGIVESLGPSNISTPVDDKNIEKLEEKIDEIAPSTRTLQDQKIIKSRRIAATQNHTDSKGNVLERGDLVEINASLNNRWAIYDKDGYFIHVTFARHKKTKMEVLREKLDIVVKDAMFYKNNLYDSSFEQYSPDEIIQRACEYIGEAGESKQWQFKNSQDFAYKMRYNQRKQLWNKKIFYLAISISCVVAGITLLRLYGLVGLLFLCFVVPAILMLK